MKALYTSRDVHKAIKEVFAPQYHRRIAIVAYIGEKAESFLPSPAGIEIICCPEPGATSPNAIRSLIKRNVNIQFSDNLHSKVYWSEKGCVVTSANISHRALGKHNQKEVGILVDSSQFDIDRLINESSPYKISQKALNKLDKQHRKIFRKMGVKPNKNNQISFIDWYESPYREIWKIGWWHDSDLETAKNAIKKSIIDYNVDDPQNIMNIAKKQVANHEWLLCFKIRNNRISKLEWMYVDFIVPVDETDEEAYEEEYPFQAIQVHELNQYPLPPFTITKEFESSFTIAVNKFGTDKIETSPSLNVPEEILKEVAGAM